MDLTLAFYVSSLNVTGSGLNVILEPLKLNSDYNQFLTMPQYYL